MHAAESRGGLGEERPVGVFLMRFSTGGGDGYVGGGDSHDKRIFSSFFYHTILNTVHRDRKTGEEEIVFLG